MTHTLTRNVIKNRKSVKIAVTACANTRYCKTCALRPRFD